MAVNPNSKIYKSFSISTRGPTAMPMPNPKETGSEEDGDLRKKKLSEQSIEPTPLTKSEQNLRALIKMRREFFEKINDPNAQKVKSGLPGDFLYESEYFKIALGLLETAAALFKLPQIADSFAKGLNEMIEEYNPSPDVTRHFNKIMNGGADPNEIKLNVEKNIYEQLEKLKVTDSTDKKILTYADYINEKTLTYAQYLDKRSHFIPMELPDGKFLFLDISRYYRDREQHLAEGPPLGPQESNQKQHVAEGPQDSTQKNPDEGQLPGPQKRDHQEQLGTEGPRKRKVTWAPEDKLVEERVFTSGNKSNSTTTWATKIMEALRRKSDQDASR